MLPQQLTKDLPFQGTAVAALKRSQFSPAAIYIAAPSQAATTPTPPPQHTHIHTCVHVTYTHTHTKYIHTQIHVHTYVCMYVHCMYANKL